LHLAAALAAACLAGGAAAGAQIDPDRYLEHVKVLASEQMKGRAAGSPEADDAARYIAGQFKAFGLTPLAPDFLQPLPITVSARLGQGNRMAVSEGARTTELRFDEDFRPLAFSGSGAVAGRVVFAGYGITAREYGYDDYAGIDARGKLVIVMRHEPQEFDWRSIFSGRVYTNHGQLQAKAANARAHGAAAVLFVNDKPNHPSESGALAPFTPLPGPPPAGLPFVEVRSEIVEGWLKASGRSLADIVNGIDRDLRPRSFSLPASLRVELTTAVEQETREVYNVVGFVPGATSEYVIVGAHYDHVGLGEQFSMSPGGAGAVHYGADDNASGVAAVLELARWFASRPKPKRGVVLAAFTAEEIGLVGANYLADHPLVPFGEPIAMINMDMIGRLREREVFVGGAGTGKGFAGLLERANRDFQLKLNTSDPGGYGSSDQFAFLPKSIPILFFFTGHHGDYHTPADTWDRIDARGAAAVGGLAGTAAEAILESARRPRFTGGKR
jgi:hypothetical protein